MDVSADQSAMARKVQAAGKRGGRDEGEKVVHRLKYVFGNVEETLIRKVSEKREREREREKENLTELK